MALRPVFPQLKDRMQFGWHGIGGCVPWQGVEAEAADMLPIANLADIQHALAVGSTPAGVAGRSSNRVVVGLATSSSSGLSQNIADTAYRFI
eukprot:scaffold252220_cov29-Prasinocladus_malaysianus.AAC.1